MPDLGALCWEKQNMLEAVLVRGISMRISTVQQDFLYPACKGGMEAERNWVPQHDLGPL